MNGALYKGLYVLMKQQRNNKMYVYMVVVSKVQNNKRFVQLNITVNINWLNQGHIDLVTFG